MFRFIFYHLHHYKTIIFEAMNDKIKFAIIGYGNIGHRHAEHIIHNKHAALIAVCDIVPEKKNELQTGIAFYTNADEMLATINADVVCICTPNYLHEQHSIAALKAGKHVVVEKPMAISVEACNNMIDVATSVNKKIFAVKQNRYNPPVQAVKKLMTSNELGKIYLVQVNCFWNRGDNYYASSDWRGKKAQDGGVLFTQFSHFIDILYYLNGSITEVKGLAKNYAHTHNTELDDTGIYVMKATNGSMVNFNFTTCAYQKNMEGSITIFAEKGTVKIGGQYLNTIEYQRLEGIQLPEINITAKANDYGLYQGSMSNHDKVIENVIDVLQHDKPMMTTAEEAREVVRIIEEMYACI